jgi:hypothetical protein
VTRFPEAREAWRRLKFAWADYWAARVGCTLSRKARISNPYIPFSVRNAITKAIEEPGQVLPRGEGENWVELRAHWQARAALEVVLSKAATSPLFAAAIADAQGIEAGTAETVQQGSVHESPVGASRCAQPQSGVPNAIK